MEPALEVRQLTKTYGRRAAVDRLDLHVEIGDVYGFLGPNGAGKTTAIRCVLGLIPFDTGTVRLFGHEGMQGRVGVGAVVETPAFHDWMTGVANLKEAGWYIGLSGKALDVEIDRVLDRVALRERGRDRAGTYSLGMRQRLGIARALLGKPRMLFLDEPTNGLDPAGMREMRELIRSLAMHDQITVFMSSHLLAEIQAVCNRVGILQTGTLRAEGVVSELLAQAGDPIYVVACDDPAFDAKLAASERCTVLGSATVGLRVQSSMTPAELNRWCFEQGLVLSALARESRSLEEVFMEAVG